MKKEQQPRGIRNNNPLNIIHTKDNWLGLRNPQYDKRFCEFTHMKYGYRAAAIILKKYMTHYHWNTITEIISAWAPHCENNTQAYIDAVCKMMDVTPDYEITFDNQPMVCMLMSAMTVVENGKDWNPMTNYLTLWTHLYDGYILARGARRNLALYDYEPDAHIEMANERCAELAYNDMQSLRAKDFNETSQA